MQSPTTNLIHQLIVIGLLIMWELKNIGVEESSLSSANNNVYEVHMQFIIFIIC